MQVSIGAGVGGPPLVVFVRRCAAQTKWLDNARRLGAGGQRSRPCGGDEDSRGLAGAGFGDSGTEEDGFALKSFDGEEDGDSRIDACGGKDIENGTPVIGAGDNFLADQAGV